MEKPAPIEELGGEARPGNGDRGRTRGATAANARAGLIGAIVGAAVVGAAWAGMGRRDQPQAIQAEDGALRVHYTIQTTPTSSEGSSITGASRIEFHPGYVVVRRGEGAGHVFFNDHTMSLSWSR